MRGHEKGREGRAADEKRGLSRRTTLALLPAAVAGVGLTAGVGAWLLPPASRDPARFRRVCRLADMDVGGQVSLPENVLVVRTERGLHAISLVCTHLGCGLTHHEGGFVCHCHGSRFDEEGHPLEGPARRDLTWYAVRVVGDWVMVDLDHPVPSGTILPV